MDKIPAKYQAALIRGLRTFVQAFGASVAQYWLANGTPKISSLIDAFAVQSDTAAAVGLIAAGAALGLNFFRPISPETK